MRALLLLFLSVVMVSCQTITEPDIMSEAPPTTEESAFRVIGYHTWWSGNDWQQYDFSALDALYFFGLEVGSDGSLANTRGWPESWRGLIATSRATETSILPTVTILDMETYVGVFSDSVATDTLFSALVRLALDPASDGVHLDFEVFEPVPAAVRQSVTDLVVRLRTHIDEHRPEAQLTMFTLAQDAADVMDEAALAPHLDHLIVQAYDMHWLTSDTAGPVAPVRGWGDRNWQSVLTRYSGMGVPREKMLFTVPYFGYEWPTEDFIPGSATRGPAQILASGQAIADVPSALERANLHGKLRDEASGSPYYAYRDSLGWYQGWFEDERSIVDKYAFVRNEHLAGVAIFPLAYGDVALQAALVSARSGSVDPVSP